MSLLCTSKLVLIFLLLSQIVESRLIEENLTSFFGTSSNSNVDEGTKWAVLVAGSKGFENYRHQADICHAYQILKRGGLKDENIIVFMYDDIAYNKENPRRGIIINNPHGEDVYKGVPKDYTGNKVTTHNLLSVILGDKKNLTGGSGKVVKSGPNDHIFIYYADHGSPGVLTMPSGGDLYAKDLIKTLRKKHASGTYRSMVIYIEACEAGSIFQGLLPKDWNIYVTTASNPSESSWATYCPGSSQGPSPPIEYDTCLGDLYSVAWMEDSDVRDLQAETLEQQYRVVKSRTASGKDIGSHVMQYGDINLSRDPLSLYMGINPDYNPKNHSHHHHHLSHPMPHAAFDQHEADIIYLKEKVRKAAEGSFQKAQAQKKLDEAIAHRKHVDSSIEAIGKALFGVDNASGVLKTVRSADQALVDDWDCLKMLVASYKTYCGPLLSYGMQYTRAFANMCNAGVQKEQVIKATSLVCKNRLNI